MNNLFFATFLLLFITSCGVDQVNFLNPQPESLDPLSEIPNEYQGEFIVDGDTHIVTMNSIDGISIVDDSVVVKKRGSYFYVNRINDKGFYNLIVLRRVNYLNHESISLYAPQFNIPDIIEDYQKEILVSVDSLGAEEIESLEVEFLKQNLEDKLEHYKLFNIVGGLSPFYDIEYKGDLVLENVTVNQLSILMNASKIYAVERIQ
tara:strand:+ start:9197 stop:9811 length:615 start_codon:yes stop_codon:yes gene_type:complete